MKSKLIHQTKHEINVNGFSYLSHIAASGNDNIVDKWIKEAPSAVYQAIYGYAAANKITPMETLISEAPDKGKAMKMAVRGLVRGNHLDELYKIKDYRTYKADIVFGYAQAGNQDMVAIMVNRDPSLFETAVQGYASAGHAKPLLLLIKGTKFYGEAIYQAAKAGHVELVNQLLEAVGFSEDIVLSTAPMGKEEIRLAGFLNKALSGYCKGYHLEAAANLLSKGANIQVGLDSLKIAGKPCLDAYIGLYLSTSSAKAQPLLDQIQEELSLDEGSLTSAQVENIKDLREEYLSQEGTSLVAFLSELSSEHRLPVFEELDTYFSSTEIGENIDNVSPPLAL